MTSLPMSGPGKFEGLPEIAEYVYQLPPGVEVGSVDEDGVWYGVVKGFSASDASEVLGRPLTQEEEQFLEELVGAIVTEDSNGFVSVVWYTDAARLSREWAGLEASFAE